jgi:hypothetical protein
MIRPPSTETAMHLRPGLSACIRPTPEGASQYFSLLLCAVVGLRASAVLSVLSMWAFYGSKVWDITIFSS